MRYRSLGRAALASFVAGCGSSHSRSNTGSGGSTSAGTTTNALGIPKLSGNGVISSGQAWGLS